MNPPYPLLRLRCMVVFYGVITVAGAGLVWAHSGLAGLGRTVSGPGLGTSLVLGLALAAAGLVATWSGLRTVRWMRRLARVARRFLGPLSWSDAALLGLASGVGEEMLFRAGLQPWLGWIPTSLLFGGLHMLPPLRRNWPWTAFAVIFGLAVGGLYQVTGNLAGPVAAHVVLNTVNLRRIGQL